MKCDTNLCLATKEAQCELKLLHSFSAPVCLLLSPQMPEMDGFEATEMIREEERRRSQELGQEVHVPIVALTADILAETRQRCHELGMEGFLSKPIEDEQLQAVLERCMPERAIGYKP